jgi:Fe2+ transport system protein FeoA
MKTLNDAKPGDTLLILAIKTTDSVLRHKLETMGLIPGQSLHVHNQSASGLIAEVKGSRLALGTDLAEGLLVEKIDVERHWQKNRNHDNLHEQKKRGWFS